MRLLSCHISGFGQIKNYSYDFNQGLDAICEDNGWGKTTFSVFLKAMFYGMEYSTRTKVLTERKHYLPWDGGVCGGQLTFEAGGKEYRVERTFGRTDKEDTFCLIDVVTGAESKDYSANLGEELFEVDRDSFEKSIFVPQSAIATGMTDSLNAKMGNLAATKDDINNFDSAVSRVEDVRKAYTRKSKVNNGKLNIIKEEISACNEVIDKKAAVLDGYYKQTELLEEKKKKLNWMEAEKNRVAEQIRLQSKKEQDMGAYRQQLEFFEAQNKKLEELDDFFRAGVPTAEEQEAIEDVERQFDMSKRTKVELLDKMPVEPQIQKWERLFADGIPSQEDIESWNEKATYVQELRLQGKHAKLSEEATKQLEELKFFFSKKTPSEEELSKVESDVVELSKLEGRIVEQDENYRNLKAQREIVQKDSIDSSKLWVVVLLFALSAAFLVGTLAFHTLIPDNANSVMVQVICIGGMVAMFVAGIMQLMRLRGANKNRQDDVEQRLLEATVALEQSKGLHDELSKSTKEFLSSFLLTPADTMQQMVYEIRVNLDRYLRLMEEEQLATANSTGKVEEMADVQLELYTALGHYAEVYELDLYHENGEAILLEKLKKDADFYSEYVMSKKQMELLCVTMEKQEKLLTTYIQKFPLDEELTPAEALKLVRGNIERYARTQEEITKLQESMAEFADMKQVESDALSVEELQGQQEKIENEIQEMHRGITQDNETLLSLADELDVIEEAENRREVLLEERTDCENKVELLTKTEEYLQMAKEQFLSKYMSPLRKGMDHYLTLMDEKYKGDAEGMDFDITMDLSIQVMQNGATHASDYLSHGYQDLVALCARFALVDVLYQKEQPMIVLDDPFTNLDEEKTKRALQLLQAIAKERQIIYYTCHESRMPKES